MIFIETKCSRLKPEVVSKVTDEITVPVVSDRRYIFYSFFGTKLSAFCFLCLHPVSVPVGCFLLISGFTFTSWFHPLDAAGKTMMLILS